eukprot:238355-Pelagomonas_calceolata.AAC.1
MLPSTFERSFMALPIKSPAELRFFSKLCRHALSTLNVQAFIFESAAQSTQDVPESAVQKCKCGPSMLLILPHTSVSGSKCAFTSQSALLRLKSALESAYKAHTKCNVIWSHALTTGGPRQLAQCWAD